MGGSLTSLVIQSSSFILGHGLGNYEIIYGNFEISRPSNNSGCKPWTLEKETLGP